MVIHTIQIFLALSLSTPQAHGQLTDAQMIYSRMKATDDISDLLSLYAEMKTQPLEDRLALVEEFKSAGVDPFYYGNFRKHIFKILMDLAAEAPEVQTDIIRYFEGSVIFSTNENESPEPRKYGEIRSAAIWALGDAMTEGQKVDPLNSLSIRCRHVLVRVAHSNLPRAEDALRVFDRNPDELDANLFLEVARNQNASAYSRQVALGAISAQQRDLSDGMAQWASEVLLEIGRKELKVSNPSASALGVHEELLRTYREFQDRPNHEKLGAMVHAFYKSPSQTTRTRRALYEALTVYSDLPVVRETILNAKEEDPINQNALHIAQSLVLYLRDQQLNPKQKEKLWTDLLDTLANTSEMSQRTSILPGLRLAWTENLMEEAAPEGSTEWKNLPKALRGLILIEAPQSRTSVEPFKNFFLGVITGGFGFFVNTNSSSHSSSEPSQPAYEPYYYNLREDLVIDKEEAEEAKKKISEFLSPKNPN